MGRFGTKKCALLQCVFWRSRLTHAHHLWRKRVRRRYYRFVNRHLVSFVISESTNGVYMDWGRFYPRRCWGLLAVFPYGLCSFPSPHIRPQRGRKFPSLINNARRSGRRSPSPFMERGTGGEVRDLGQERSWSRVRCHKNPSLGPDIGVAGWRSRRRQASPAPRASILATAPLALIALSEFVYTSTNLYSGMRQRLRQASRGVSNPNPAPKCVMQLLPGKSI